MRNDPMGAALAAYMQGAKDAEIIVASNLAEDDVIPVHYLFRSVQELPELELQALRQCRGTILDVGAGAGSHSLALQDQGYEVTAIDVSAGAVDVMRQRGVKQVLHQDVFELKGQQYDTLLMLMNGIGIAGNLLGLDRFLEHAKSLLKPGGQILLESSDILYMYEEEDGSVMLDLNAGYYGEVKYNMKFKEAESGWFNWLFVDQAILEDYAHEQGFACEILYDGENGEYLARLSVAEA